MTKISQLGDISGSLAAGDEFVIRDVSDISTPNKKVTASGFVDYVIAQGVGSGFTQISAGATAPASVRCFSSGTTREVIVTTSGVERARFLTDGTLRLLNSPGIDFSQLQVNAAGMTSETLDSYEEGTWTPSQGGGLTVVGTFSSAGIYTKIGRQVTVAFRLTGSTSIAASFTNDLFDNLPFVVSSSTVAIQLGVSLSGALYVTNATTEAQSAVTISATSNIYGAVTYTT